MAGKIDRDGLLWLMRRGTMRQQLCPHTDNQPCGDWCPKFKEPKNMALTICAEQTFPGIIDDRIEGRGNTDIPARVEPPLPEPELEPQSRKRGPKRAPKRYWLKDGEYLECPECHASRPAGNYKKNKPRRCLRCGIGLEM